MIDRKPYIMRSSEQRTDFCSLCIKSGHQLIYCRAAEERAPLCYPLEGEKPIVSFNSKKVDELCDEWDLSELTTDRRSGDLIKAAKGKFKGWYLDWSENEIEVSDDGKVKHVRELILVKEPKVVRKFRKFPIAP